MILILRLRLRLRLWSRLPLRLLSPLLLLVIPAKAGIQGLFTLSLQPVRARKNHERGFQSPAAIRALQTHPAA
ncbi:hypothetical protein ACHZ97_16150 [Lysobacter soli]|uniref:hypothetical protein n=1 Tax=Lysobacter soli TaxID=453783 RepID=UPI0037C66C89